MPGFRRRRRTVLVLFIATTMVLTLSLLEGFLATLRHVPALSFAPAFREIARELYMLDRNMIQFETEATRWDPRLGYTLRSGEFRFSNTEFDTAYSCNRLGVRDDEQSLDRPQVVVIGDSFAMGWGVEQTEAFPSVFEELTGLRVLNTAVASYGTARQLRLLESVDLSHATHLMIQFCNNDYFENLAFDREGPDFATQKERGYEKAVARYMRGKRYFPGRYSIALLTHRFGRARNDPSSEDAPDLSTPAAQRLQAELFLNVLSTSAIDLDGLRIIVFELNSYNRYRGLFIPMLAETIRDGDYEEAIRNIQIVDLAKELHSDHWFRLDDHLTPAGHRQLANRLLKLMSAPLPDAAVSTGRGTTATGPVAP